MFFLIVLLGCARKRPTSTAEIWFTLIETAASPVGSASCEVAYRADSCATKGVRPFENWETAVKVVQIVGQAPSQIRSPRSAGEHTSLAVDELHGVVGGLLFDSSPMDMNDVRVIATENVAGLLVHPPRFPASAGPRPDDPVERHRGLQRLGRREVVDTVFAHPEHLPDCVVWQWDEEAGRFAEVFGADVGEATP